VTYDGRGRAPGGVRGELRGGARPSAASSAWRAAA
jgi:hypothetical protein